MARNQRLAGFLVAAAAIGVCVVAAYALTIGRFTSPWMGDAGRYIEATRSLLEGKPLLLRHPWGEAPMRDWPPGYPVLGALFAATGLSARDALLLVTRLSLAGCVPAAVWAFAPALGGWLSLLVGVFCLTSPGLLPNANLASTDAVFCLVSIVAAGSLIRGRLLLIGLLISVGLCLRNSAIALVLATVIVVAAEHRPNAATARNVARLALGGLPLFAALMAWNGFALGSLRPYSMPPSTRGLLLNLGDLGTSLMSDFVSVYRVAHAIPWMIAVLVVLLLSVYACGFAVRRGHLSSAVRRFLLFAGSYVIVGLAMTVYARTRYQWGELIWERHTSQYDWLLPPAVIVMVILCTTAIRKPIVSTLVVLSVLMIGLRCVDTADRFAFYSRTAGEVSRIVRTGNTDGADPHIQLRQMYKAYEQEPGLAAVGHALNRSCQLVSNMGDLLNAVYNIQPVDTLTVGTVAGPLSVLDAALPPPLRTAGAMAYEPAQPDDLVPVSIAGVPPSIRIRSNLPDICFPPASR